MAQHVIFVSCGQLTESERALGLAIKEVIDSAQGFIAYFAQAVQNLEGLSTNVLTALRTCAGAVVILQDRGALLNAEGVKIGRRSSVWVNQEVAILAYRQFVE